MNLYNEYETGRFSTTLYEDNFECLNILHMGNLVQLHVYAHFLDRFHLCSINDDNRDYVSSVSRYI